MRKFAKDQDEAEINMTPMLDIVFIMLIFFIVTASFVKEQGLEMTQPPDNQPPPPEEEKKQNIIIRVDNNNQVWVINDYRRIDIRSVRPNIERLHAAHKEGIVVIQAEPNANAGLVVQIYDQAKIVDEKIGISVVRHEP